MLFDNEQMKSAILKSVGEGRMEIEDAHRALEAADIEVTEGFRRSLLAFRASALLVAGGFTRTGQPQR
jgi:hypothetical protein